LQFGTSSSQFYIQPIRPRVLQQPHQLIPEIMASGSSTRQWPQSLEEIWELRDKRMDGLPLLSSPLPTLIICLTYVYIVKVAGPRFMKNREPYNIRTFLIVYNAAQVIISAYIFYWLLQGGWIIGDYSFVCQPVDYSDSRSAKIMMHVSYIYYLSKFSEFIDTFAFVARKKFSHVSTLHVIHHGIMPLSVWPGLRFVPGGHATFFGLCNVFIHFFMYLYYMFAAMGPQYQKYLFWKRQMTNMQMVQFIAMFVHSMQLLVVPDCGFPVVYGYVIAAHAVMFFILFSQFYVREYLSGKSKKNVKNGHSKAVTNGHSGAESNGHSTTNGHSHSYNTRSKKDH